MKHSNPPVRAETFNEQVRNDGPVAALSPIFQAISAMRREGRKPRFVLLGFKEYDSFRANVLPGYPDYRITKEGATVFGLELLCVDRESFFEVV